jgi:hypothetical protein
VERTVARLQVQIGSAAAADLSVGVFVLHSTSP